MKKLAVVIVVVLLLVTVAPVLAAIVFEWSTGDSCDIWQSGCDPEWGLSIIGYQTIRSDALGITASDQLLDATVDEFCSGNISILNASNVVQYTSGFSSLPIQISLSPDFYIRLATSGEEEMCMISNITIGEEDVSTPTPTPSPTSTPSPGMLDSFAVNDVFATANDIAGAMMSVVALIAGIAIGFKILSWLIARIR